MWIKICGNTSLEDAQAAVDAGANAVGFVFAESPRRVTLDQVREIAPKLPQRVEKYGVFVDADYDEIAATLRACRLTGVQLHGPRGPQLALRLREDFGTSLRILGVLHYAGEFEAQLAALSADKVFDAVLIDSRTAKAVGGTGIAFDWQSARNGFVRSASDVQLIVAGGLNPENVGEAISTLLPWGVDVVTGVEAAPGRKDPAKIEAFIQAARAAAVVNC